MIAPSRTQIGAFLRQGSWFGGLPHSLQERFLDLAEVRTFPRGRIIQSEEGEGVGMIALVEGSVRFLHHVPDREPTLLHVGEPGFWFGQLAVLDRGRPVATAVSRTPIRAVVLTRPAFARLAAEDSRLGPAVRQVVDDRLRITHRFLAQVLDLSADERLRARLADLADIRRLEVRVVGPSVVLGLTQAELAKMVRLARQQVNARLRALEASGLVELEQRRIRVLDSGRLRGAALNVVLPRSRSRPPATP